MAARKVLVLYYSGGGNTKKMAEAIAEAIRSSGLEIALEEVGRLDVPGLPVFDGIVVGSPTYFSNIAWQVKKIIDESIMHYGGKKLGKKVAGIFTSAGSRKNGEDCLKMLEVAFGTHHEMRVVARLLRVDGEDDQETRKRCQEFGNQVAEAVGKA